MDDSVYLGVWKNFSNGSMLGATFTTTRRNGNLIIAFTGFLIPFVASRFWIILCLVCHVYYSTPEPRDAVHHQRQVILRNSDSPDAGLVSLCRLLWAWRKSRDKSNRYARIVPVLLLAVCCISVFTAATGFSSRISSASGDEVLINSDQCGISHVDSDITSVTDFSEKLDDAANYAQQCYSAQQSGILGCDKFVVQHLPTFSASYNSSCPFPDASICRSKDTNIRLDTGYIDSNNDLGLNAPEDQRFSWRYVLQCAPLITDGHTVRVQENNRTLVRYKYGKLTPGFEGDNSTFDFTYEIEDLDSQYYDMVGTLSGTNYKLRRVPAHLPSQY